MWLAQCSADNFGCLALRKMPFRNAKDAHRQDETFPIEARLAIFRNSIHAQRQPLLLFSPRPSRKNGVSALWFTQNPDTTFWPYFITKLLCGRILLGPLSVHFLVYRVLASLLLDKPVVCIQLNFLTHRHIVTRERLVIF